LNSIKQSNIAAEQTRIQIEDNRIALKQGESVRRLTFVNMLFLPPSFVAAVFSMNTTQTQELHIWLFFVVASTLLLATIGLVTVQYNFFSSEKDAAEQYKDEFSRLSQIQPNSVARGILAPLLKLQAQDHKQQPASVGEKICFAMRNFLCTGHIFPLHRTLRSNDTERA